MLEKMKALVRQKDICVLATVSEDKPHCSLMAYVSDDSGVKIYMMTLKQTSKYKNLCKNPFASILIDNRDEGMETGRLNALALTIHGIFEDVNDEKKEQEIREKLLERHPHLIEFSENPDSEMICIKALSFLLLDGLTQAYFEVLD